MAVLVGIDGEFQARRWVLNPGDNSIGRQDADVALNVASMSGRHARVYSAYGQWWVEDLESTNGTKINDQRIAIRGKVEDGDIVMFGSVRLAFSNPVEPAPASPPPTQRKVTASPAPVETHEESLATLRDLSLAYSRLKDQMGEAIVGQASVVEGILLAVLCQAHALLEGVPGLAKTLLISTLSRALSLDYRRIQFTPDLTPSDIMGIDVLEEDSVTGKRVVRFVHGPLFSHLLLADELNRTPPKTQSALLDAMQEHHVTVGGRVYPLKEPFFVLATQTPIEQEGTYPLAGTQLDRFMFAIKVGYPTADEESEIIRRVTTGVTVGVDAVLQAESILRLQKVVREAPVAGHVIRYARDLARATRPKQPEAPDFVTELVGCGAGPSAGINLVMAAKARAILYGRDHATTEDVSWVAHAVLRHRVIITSQARNAGVTSDEIITRLLDRQKPEETVNR